MNVFHRFTRQSLRKNRSRTWVTIVGIVLSVAMFTAVTEGAYSGVRYLVRTTEYTVGRFHGCYQNLTEQQATQLSRDEKEIAEMSAWQTVGWGNIGSQNEYKPYLRVMSMDPDLPELVSIRLAGGRLPDSPAGAPAVQRQCAVRPGGHHGAGAGPPDAGWGGADGR